MNNKSSNPPTQNESHVQPKANIAKKIFKIITAVTILATLIFDYLIITDLTGNLKYRISPIEIISVIIISILISGTIITISYLSSGIAETKHQRKAIEKDIKTTIEELDVDKNLIETSFKYLNEYYLQTREHAQKGFIVTVAAAIVGAIIIAVGILALFLGETNPAYVTTACGVITEFIAAVYFYLYNKTIQGMNSYHNKLVLSQNIALALKLSHTLENKGDEAKMLIIQELMKDVNNHIEK